MGAEPGRSLIATAIGHTTVVCRNDLRFGLSAEGNHDAVAGMCWLSVIGFVDIKSRKVVFNNPAERTWATIWVNYAPLKAEWKQERIVKAPCPLQIIAADSDVVEHAIYLPKQICSHSVGQKKRAGFPALSKIQNP